MAISSSLQVPHELAICRYSACGKKIVNVKQHKKLQWLKTDLSSLALRRDPCSIRLAERAYMPLCSIQFRHSPFRCYSLLGPSNSSQFHFMQKATVALTRSYNALQASPGLVKLVSAVGVIVFAIWGLGPLMCQCRSIFLNKSDKNWEKSSTYHVTTSYVQPLLLWTGATLICRLLDPVVLPTEASQVVKQRILNFTRSLSSVLAFAYCLSSVIQQAQKYFMEANNSSDPRNMGYQFAGKAVSSSVWVAAVALFMELLGFSTQKWLTAGGLGTVLLTLAGREIFTNFLSSVMIHATRPFVANEWIQTKIEGYEVSGTVEHVGWWSPTIIRAEDREAVHIPNHKFTVNVVRNLTQKTHWRVKTHLGIRYLDVNKINNIVADMRKVLAKNPQVEHKRLHRRVFLEHIDPENQALMILISCFVKTSHHEEYLCVKEGIILDLLRVIRHHRAELATPIRTVQKVYKDPDLENVPFSDSIFTRGKGTTNRPLLLIEPSYKINGEEKTNPQTRPTRTNGEQEKKAAGGGSMPDSQGDSKGVAKSSSDTKTKEVTSSSSLDKEVTTATTAVDAKDGKTTVTSTPDRKPGEKGTEKRTSKSNAKEPKKTILGSTQQNEGGDNSNTTLPKQENERPTKLPISRPAMEENLILGVALEGSKRTLPIEEEMDPPLIADSKELAASRSGNGSASSENEKKDNQLRNICSAKPKSNDQQDLKSK